MKKLFTLLILGLISIGMLSKVNATTCAGAALVPGTPTFPYVTSLTCGTTNDISSTNATVCGSGSYLGGWEAVYAWTPDGSYINVSFAYSGQTWTGVFLYQGCPTAGGICIGNVTGSGSAKTLAYVGTNQTSGTAISVNAGVTYYIVIDIWPTPDSPCPGTLTINGTLNLACSGTPDPGNTLSSANPACSGSNFTLSLQNATTGSGVTYEWQSSPDGLAPWTTVGTSAPTLTTSQVAATYYRCNVTCSGNTGTSIPLQVTMNTWNNCYCTSMASSIADEEIYSVTVNGTTNAYDCSTVAPGPGSLLNRYSNFTTLGSLFSLPQGSGSSFVVEENECDGTPYYAHGCAIWIDFNRDGDFNDADEMVYTEAATTVGPRNILGSIFVPSSVALGETYMRVTVAEAYSGATLTPCLAYGYGETEDYLITIAPPLACPGPIALTAAPTAYNALLGWTETGTATSWDIEYGATPYTFTGTPTFAGVTNPYTLLSLSPATQYTYMVRSNCSVKTTSTWSGPLTFTTPVACPAPTGLSVSGILETSAKLGWTETGSATAWDIELGLAGFVPTGIPTQAGVVDNPYLYGGLTAATNYSFYVRAACGGIDGNSTWTGPYSFATSCGVLTIPYCQYFPTATFPACWSEQLTGLITTNHWSTVNSAIAGGTAYEAQAYYGPGQGATQADNDRMVSPGLNTTGLTSIHLSFQQMLNDYNAGVNDVWIKVQSSSDGVNWTDEWVHNAGLGNSIPAQLKELDITNNLGGTTWIAFTLSGYTYDINYWYVDNVCISIPLPLDAQTVSIDNVPALTTPGTTITPKATVKNSGTTSPVTFDVTMTAAGYTSTVEDVTLAAGASTQVTFADWTPAVGEYTVQVCTQLVGDMDPINDCKSKAVSIQVLRKVYAYVAYDPTAGLPEGPAYFYVQSPGTIVSLAATTSDQFIGAGCWANGVWYGSEYYDATLLSGGGWWTIDPVTGAMIKKADFDQGFAGIAFNKNTNTMYGTEWTGSTNNLYTIDPLTGVATLLGSFGTSLMINLACDGTDLYAIGISDDVMYKIFPTIPPTAVALVPGTTGFSFNYGQDMEYDYDNNIMYVCGYTTTGQFMTANLTTGACTLIGNFQGGAEITGFAIPYTPVVTSKTLCVKAYLEGLYNGAGMNQAQNETGPQWDPGVADKVILELRNIVTGAVEYTINNVNLGTDGMACATVPATFSDSYYIYVYNRNHITTSSNIVLFAGATINYDFTLDVTQAFASNQKDIGGVAVFFAGDVDQSCGVDATDLIAVDNDNAAFGVGYIPTDCDGSGGIDASDMILVDNNNALFVGCALPF